MRYVTARTQNKKQNAGSPKIMSWSVDFHTHQCVTGWEADKRFQIATVNIVNSQQVHSSQMPT